MSHRETTDSRSRVAMLGATLGALTLAVVAVSIGTPSPHSNPAIVASPVSPTGSPSAAPPTRPAFAAGQTLRATRSIPLTDDWSIGVGQSMYVAGVEREGGVDVYRIQHWGDLITGLKPDTVIATVAVEIVEARAEPYVLDCPSGFEGIEPVARLQPFERLVCFGQRSLTIAPVRREEVAVMSGNPPWLGGPEGADFFTGLPFATAIGVDVPEAVWLRVTGHFDDAGCDGDLRCRERFVVTAVEPTEPPPTELRGTWRHMAPAPITGRSSAVGVWTGTEFVVWGGYGSPPPGTETAAADPAAGAAYDPGTDTWRPIADAPIGPRLAAIGVWSGREVLIWGGLTDNEATEPSSAGAAYDPANDSWRLLSEAPVAGDAAVWTGTELVILGSRGGIAAYSPATDEWRTLPEPPGDQGYFRSIVWTGAELLLFVAPDGVDSAVAGFRIAPDESAWRATAPSNYMALWAAPMIWTGTEVVGLGQYPERNEAGLSGSVAYDPATDTWREIGSCQVGLHAVWTGTRILGESGTFDPTNDSCQTMRVPPDRPAGGTTGREGSAFAWTGSEYLIWSGGNGSDYAYTDGDGVIFTPTDAP